MDDTLRRILAGALDDITALMAVRDRFTTAQFQKEMSRILITAHFAAYLAGSGARTLSPYADQLLGQIIREQLNYLARFAEQLDGLSDAQATARAALYAGSLKGTYNHGRYGIWRLPAQPGDGRSECLSNCRCIWELDVLDEENLDCDAYWIAAASESCPTCQERAATWAPLQIRGGTIL